MSMLLTAKALLTKVGNSNRKLVLVKLADNANDDGICWPSYDYIAEMCEMSRRTVIRHISDLEKMGLVTIQTRKGKSGNDSNVYKLHLGGDNLTPPGDKQVPEVVTEDYQPGDTVTPESVNEPVIESNKKNNKKNSIKGSLVSEEMVFQSLNRSAWEDYLAFRKSIKKPFKTERGERTQMSRLLELAKHDHDQQQRIVDQSIDNEWQGLFAAKVQQQAAASGINDIPQYSPDMDVSQYQAPEGFGGGQ